MTPPSGATAEAEPVSATRLPALSWRPMMDVHSMPSL